MARLRFRPDDVPALMSGLRRSVALLAAQDGFVDARIARAIDGESVIVLDVAWRTVGAYRRALSSYDVKVEAVPILSQAIDEPTAFEVLHVTDVEGQADALGALAADASSVSLGSAAADVVPPAPS